MKPMQFNVTFTRKVGQRTGDDVINAHVEKITGMALKGPRGAGWKYTVHRNAEPVQDENGLWVFNRKVSFKKVRGHLSKSPVQWKKICRVLIKAGQSSYYKQYPWYISGEGAEEIYAELAEEGKIPPFAGSIDSGDDNDSTVTSKPKVRTIVKSFGEINTDFGEYFNHIFDREHQIKIIHSALVAAKESSFVNRYHVVLQGPPGCGKSEILTALGKMLGKEHDAWMKVDATSATEAGMQRILFESVHIPPVLMVEEIEKTDEKSLRWMLGVLDHRAEIRKTNFHIGHKCRNVKMLCVATVNNIELFKKAMSGALYSRFAHEVYCPRPDKKTMQMILEREIAKVQGKQEWIAPTLKFCMDEQGITDPRKIVPICLCGRDDLLNGSYQKSLLATVTPKDKEN